VLGLFEVQFKEWEFKETKDRTVRLNGLEAKAHIGNVSVLEQRIAERNEARAKKDFAKADAIREELESQGIILEDRADGTTRWKQ
jgi:cysteinyl-tRNA synthetase